jgi:SMP-30/Gluconolactonase/LRE-like region
MTTFAVTSVSSLRCQPPPAYAWAQSCAACGQRPQRCSQSARTTLSIAFPNGMAITPDNRTLIIAESHSKRLTAFDMASDGSLSNGESGLLSATVCLTESALMLRTRFGMPTCPINVACAFGKAVRFCRPSISTADALHACSADTTRGHCSSSSPSGKGWERFRRPRGPERD